MDASVTETNPSLRKPTFETHIKPAMNAFVEHLTKDMASATPPVDATPVETPLVEVPPATPPPATSPPAEAAKTEERPWPRNAKDWDAYKKADKERLEKISNELKEAHAKYETAEKQWKTTPSIPSDYESLKKERNQLDQTLRTVAVENHPKFKAYFDGKIKEQLDLAESIGADKGKEIAELLKSPDGQWKDQRLSDLLTTLSPLQSTRIGGILNNLSAIQNERQSAINKARESHDEMLAQEQAKVKERQTKAELLFDQTAAGLQDPKNGSPAFTTREGDQKWNDSVKARIDSAKNLLFGQQEPSTMIKAALDAVALPAVLEYSKALSEENAQLKTQIKELQSSQPTLDGGSAKNGNVPQPQKIPVRRGNLAFATPQDAVKNFVTGIKQEMQGEEQ